MVRCMLTRVINRELRDVCGSQKKPLGYEKVSFRLNRSCSSPFTTQPERTGALGLLSSLSWLPLRLLASPLLASRLLVCRVLVSGLLGRVPWPSHGCSGSLLAALISRPVRSLRDPRGVKRRSAISPVLSGNRPSGGPASGNAIVGSEYRAGDQRERRALTSQSTVSHLMVAKSQDSGNVARLLQMTS
jgi:hypothetical protein